MNFLLINKPEGWTSFDVVAFVRKKAMDIVIPTTKEESLSVLEVNDGQRSLVVPTKSGLARDDKPKRIKVGHAGTLDPFATGLLIVGVGREATKKLDEFKAMPKTYVATIKLGEVSDTYDKTGKIKKFDASVIPTTKEESLSVNCHSRPRAGIQTIRLDTGFPIQLGMTDRDPSSLRLARDDKTKTMPSLKQIKKIIRSFVGKQLQIPPMFSAKKIHGKKLYELARKGIELERQPNKIEIYKIKILHYSWPFLKIEVQCSAGTYIRSLANDIGVKLGTGAYCQELVRTKIGKYTLDKAITPQSLLITT